MGSLGIIIAMGSYLCKIPVLRVITLKPKFICLSHWSIAGKRNTILQYHFLVTKISNTRADEDHSYSNYHTVLL